MTRRSGLTLVEVLTALFILALGVIAILTMFPLGASQMAIAVRESRSAEAAFNADAYFRTYWKAEVVEKGGASESFYTALDNPNMFTLTPPQPLPAGEDNPGLVPANPVSTEWSYPVFVDPMGLAARTGKGRWWIGDGGSTFAPRRNLNLITSGQQAHRLCSLMDGMGYDADGVPSPDREMRYNWLWVVQRPNNDFGSRFNANLTVVVFDRRAHLHAPVGSEQVFTATWNALDTQSGARPGLTSVRFDTAPDIKPGTWICDVTYGAAPSKMRNANFYLVTAVNGTSVELQSPIKVPSDNIALPYTGTFVVLRGVSGVYVRSPLTAGD